MQYGVTESAYDVQGSPRVRPYLRGGQRFVPHWYGVLALQGEHQPFLDRQSHSPRIL